MTAPKFTPGPWSVSGGKHPMGNPAIPRMWWLKAGAISLGTDNEADAHLCAASPDLYQALHELCLSLDASGCATDEGMERIFIAYENAQAALAKARGEL